MELFMMILAFVPVYLLRTKLGSGVFKIVKGAVIWLICALIGVSVALDVKKAEKAVEQESNKVEKKIFLKNLTTGIKTNEISGIKYVLKQKTMDTGSVQILGESRVVTFHKNDDDLITELVLLGDSFENTIVDMKRAIEERISKDNQKPVQLSCSQVNEGFYEAKTNICVVSNDTQKLALKYVKTKSNAYVNNFAWSINLTDTNLKGAQKDKESKRLMEQVEKDKSKMKSQI